MSNKLNKHRKEEVKQSYTALIVMAAAVVVILIMMISLAFRGKKQQPESEHAAETEIIQETQQSEVQNDDTAEEQDIDTQDAVMAEISVKDYGKISLALDAKAAPITVENFVKLVKDGFYDGLTFHRIMDGFMIQGGDPLGNGTGGSEEKIKGEFSANGVENPISHTRGVISMARSSEMDSASSQFFIVHQDSTFLDGQYAAFGHVTEGMDTVDAICAAITPTDNNGTVKTEDQPVIAYIKIIEE